MPVTPRVELAAMFPLTFKVAPILLEAFAMRPLLKVAKPVWVETPATLRDEPRTVAPAAWRVPLALRAPAT